MTAQQEAIRMIKNMPDDAVSILVDFLKRMMVNDSHIDNHQTSRNIRLQPSKRKLGIADGEYDIPESIDACNDEIARMFGVSE